MKLSRRQQLIGTAGMTPARLVEAVEVDLIALRDQIAGALREALKLAGDADCWPYVVALYADSVVVDHDGKLWRYPYQASTTGVVFGAPLQVVTSYVPATEATPAIPTMPTAPASGTDATLIEAVADEDGKVKGYNVRVIRAGQSLNGNYYPDAVLREAAPMFDGVRVFVKSDIAHITGAGKDVNNLVGALSQAKFVEGAAPDTGEIIAVMTLIIGDDDPTAVKLREAVSRGLSNLFGLSIQAIGTAKGVKGNQVAKSFTKINSVDLIVEPGAGGQVISFVEAVATGDFMDRAALIALINQANPALLQGKDMTTLTDADLQTVLTQALTPPAASAATGEGNATPANLTEAFHQAVSMSVLIQNSNLPPLTKQQLIAKFDTDAKTNFNEAAALNRQLRMRDLINGSRGLPPLAKQKLIDQFSTMADFTEAAVTDSIKKEITYLAAARGVGGGSVADLGDASFIEAGQDQRDKHANMLDAFLDVEHKDHKSARSLRECYVQITGDRLITGQIKDAVRLTEALDTTSFPAALGDSINRRMLKEYSSLTNLDIYKLLTGEAVPITDFRNQERVRIGGYGDLPAVAEKAPYLPLTSPGDESAEYKISKRGGLETLSLEMIANDDVKLVQRIPIKLARAAKRTLCKFVLDFIRTNPAIYDGKALFHADHNNLLSVALTDAAVATARLMQKQQTEEGSNEPYGMPFKYLWVPDALEEAASDIFKRDTNLDETFIQSLKPTIVPVPFWTDANDWAWSVDQNDIPIIELGFFNGNEDPEIFIQDNPSFGSMFTNDQVTYKIRHIYGGAPVEFRGVGKSVVANS